MIRRKSNLIVCVSLIVAAVVITAAIAVPCAEAFHDCRGDCCPICALISRLFDLCKYVLAVVACAAVISAASAVRRHATRISRLILLDSPVVLKVKMSN